MADWSLAKRWLESGCVIRNSMMRKTVFLKLIGSKMTMFEDGKVLEVSYNLNWNELSRRDWEIFQPEPEIIADFNKFIKKWCGSSYAHLIDSDDNDGERFRRKLRQDANCVEDEQ